MDTSVHYWRCMCWVTGFLEAGKVLVQIILLFIFLDLPRPQPLYKLRELNEDRKKSRGLTEGRPLQTQCIVIIIISSELLRHFVLFVQPNWIKVPCWTGQSFTKLRG